MRFSAQAAAALLAAAAIFSTAVPAPAGTTTSGTRINTGRAALGTPMINHDPSQMFLMSPARVFRQSSGLTSPRLTAPTSAQIVRVSGSTLTFRTTSGMLVGVRVPASRLRFVQIRVGMRARLIPLNQGSLRVLIQPAAPCTQRPLGASVGCVPTIR